MHINENIDQGIVGLNEFLYEKNMMMTHGWKFVHGWKLGLLVSLGLLLFFWLIKASVMAIYISDKMNVPVTVRWITIWPSEATLHGFRIANPPRFRKASALRVNRTKVSYDPKTILSNPSEIGEILFDGVTLNVELPNTTKTDNNWGAIGAGMKKSGKGKGVVVHKLVITNLTVETLGKGADALGVAGTQFFDRIELDGIDSREGFPTKELVSQLFEKVGLLSYLEKFINPTERMGNTLNLFNLFGLKEPSETRGPFDKDAS